MPVIFRSTFGLADSQHIANRPGGGNPVFLGRGANGLDELTVTGSTGKVQDGGGGDFATPQYGYVTMRATGPVWVHVAAAPVAVVAKGFFMDLGERLTLAVEEGDKLAVINDS